MESELKSATEQVKNLQSQIEQSQNSRDELENSLKSAKSQITQNERQFQAKIKEIEELKVLSEKSDTETQKALQKKSEELIANANKLIEANHLIDSFKEVQQTTDSQIKVMKEEIEKHKNSSEMPIRKRIVWKKRSLH